MVGKGTYKFWYTILALFFSWLILFYFYYSDLLRDNLVNTYQHNENSIRKEINGFIPDNQIHLTENEAQSINKVFGSGNGDLDSALSSISPNQEEKVEEEIDLQPAPLPPEEEKPNPEEQSCSGRYIYIHDLPSQFNQDLLKHCELLSEWTNLCPFVSNFGFGPRIRNPGVFPETGWFNTNQFMLEVILHSRMKEYKCLTNDSSMASAIFVPYYSGLDVVRYLWSTNSTLIKKDQNPDSLVTWLREKPEWEKLWGRDHFLVAGRITWDFRRQTDQTFDWGNRLMLLPESKNMTFLTIESSPWHENDFAIPYPSYFHPSSDHEIYTWQNRMRRIKRKYLFSFAGAPRPNKDTDIRGEIITQCQTARRKCTMINECKGKHRRCYNPVYVMKMFQNSVFCLQPPGDSYTRRSAFDSILSGCIPVFFHPGSAYVQYIWHLPKDYTKYSVFIPANEIKTGKRNIARVLSKIPKGKRLAMKEEVLKLIPGVVYANASSSLETFEDAFDITIDGVLERVEKIREEIKNGKDFSVDDQEEPFTWKKNLFGTVGVHEWDPFFRRA